MQPLPVALAPEPLRLLGPLCPALAPTHDPGVLSWTCPSSCLTWSHPSVAFLLTALGVLSSTYDFFKPKQKCQGVGEEENKCLRVNSEQDWQRVSAPGDQGARGQGAESGRADAQTVWPGSPSAWAPGPWTLRILTSEGRRVAGRWCPHPFNQREGAGEAGDGDSVGSTPHLCLHMSGDTQAVFRGSDEEPASVIHTVSAGNTPCTPSPCGGFPAVPWCCDAEVMGLKDPPAAFSSQRSLFWRGWRFCVKWQDRAEGPWGSCWLGCPPSPLTIKSRARGSVWSQNHLALKSGLCFLFPPSFQALSLLLTPSTWPVSVLPLDLAVPVVSLFLFSLGSLTSSFYLPSLTLSSCSVCLPPEVFLQLHLTLRCKIFH